jgi:hypothetical protein
MENQTNPLKSYFRKPGIWIKLPSQGKFYSTKLSELNDMGEIPVYPMTAKDELMLKNADALLNGTAIYKMIESCVPSIKNVEEIPSIDLDMLLLAIRRCTYGDSLDITTNHTCKENADTESSLNLDYFIASAKIVDTINAVELDNGIKVFVKPVNLKQLLNLNWVQYEQVRNIQLAEQQDADEKQKLDILQKGYEALTEQNVNVVSTCIDTVLLPDSVSVSNPEHIKEWVQDLDNLNFKKLEREILSLGELGIAKSFKVHCRHCGEEYESQLDLNPTTFFE